MSFLSCLGSRRRGAHGDTEPLLAQHANDETARQHELHRKLHSYQMLRALSKGFMPSTEQTVALLRSILASDVLNPSDAALSDSGRQLAKHCRLWIRNFIDLLLSKNSSDSLQDLIWCLSKLRLGNSPAIVASRTSATAKSVQTIASLLLTNSDFRLLLSDLQSLGRQVFRDVAHSTSSAIDAVADQADPGQRGESDASALERSDAQAAPTNKDLLADTKDFGASVSQIGGAIGNAAEESAKDHLSGPEKQILLRRLQSAVGKLRQRPDYGESVSTLTLLLRHFCLSYVQATDSVVNATKTRVDADPYISGALSSLSLLLTSFGDPEAWSELHLRWNDCIKHLSSQPDFASVVDEFVLALQKILTDPQALSDGKTDFPGLRQAFMTTKDKSGSFEGDVDLFLTQAKTVLFSLSQDEQVANLWTASLRLFHVLSPENANVNTDLARDALNVMLPLLIQAVQYVPIPRLEVSSPEVDLLLENLILEPGVTVNQSSFLPYKLRVENYNDVEIRKARHGVASQTTSLASIKMDGLSVRAEDLGFWLRAHKGLLRFGDEGIASFRLDERGIDIHVDVEIGKDRLEQVLSLRAVRVHIHKLSYKLRKSKLACLAWVLKPVLALVIRKTIERQLAEAIAGFLHAANREIVFMRERLRATRIAQPQDLATFAKAVLSRLTPDDNPDLSVRIGVKRPTEGVFRDVYAPGSLVKTWVEEGERAAEVVEDFERRGWHNDIFDAVISS